MGKLVNFKESSSPNKVVSSDSKVLGPFLGVRRGGDGGEVEEPRAGKVSTRGVAAVEAGEVDVSKIK